MTPQMIYSIGVLVEVDNTKTGYIINIDDTDTSNVIFKINYTVGNEIEENVSKSRCRPVNLRRSSTTRSGVVRQAVSVSIDPPPSVNPPPPPNTTPTTIGNPPIPLDAREYERLQKAIKKSRTWIYSNTSEHPLYQLLKDGKKKDKGWIFGVLPISVFEKKEMQIQGKAKVLYLVMAAMFIGFESKGGLLSGWKSYLMHAWAVSSKFLTRSFDIYVNRNFDTKRKERSDAGVNIFCDDSKRRQTFTALNSFKKVEQKKFRVDPDKMDQVELTRAFKALPPEEKDRHELLAGMDLERARGLEDELKELMQKTKGKISYLTISRQLGEIVCADVIRRHIMRQPSFRLRKDRLLPHLDAAARGRRVTWGHAFWIFWKSARCVSTENVLIVLVHMDEKWFFTVKSRSNIKVIPGWGVDGADSHVQHKSHVGKEMYIVVTAFVLNKNDITKGGRAVPISCIRVGKMVKAARDSYRRVYKGDGTFHYPKISVNLLRKKGEEYFQAVELTGSSEGTDKLPKMSLLKAYRDTIVPDLERKVVERFSENGSKKVCIVMQEDGAGLHTNATYLKGKRALFDDRDWLIFNQPSQSPTLNVHDFTIFPAMSKAVSREQALVYGSRVMKGEELNKAVTSVFDDRDNLPAMSRGFAGHHQVVCSVLEHAGDNSYLKEKRGTSFGVRRHFIENEERDGVDGVISIDIPEYDQSMGERFLARRAARQLRYLPPDTRNFSCKGISEEMKDWLREKMDSDMLAADDEMVEVWDRIDNGNENEARQSDTLGEEEEV